MTMTKHNNDKNNNDGQNTGMHQEKDLPSLKLGMRELRR